MINVQHSPKIRSISTLCCRVPAICCSFETLANSLEDCHSCNVSVPWTSTTRDYNASHWLCLCQLPIKVVLMCLFATTNTYNTGSATKSFHANMFKCEIDLLVKKSSSQTWRVCHQVSIVSSSLARSRGTLHSSYSLKANWQLCPTQTWECG